MILLQILLFLDDLLLVLGAVFMVLNLFLDAIYILDKILIKSEKNVLKVSIILISCNLFFFSLS